MCVHASGERERERERPYWKEGQGTECFHRLSSQRLQDQTAFVAHTLSKPGTLWHIKYHNIAEYAYQHEIYN